MTNNSTATASVESHVGDVATFLHIAKSGHVWHYNKHALWRFLGNMSGEKTLGSLPPIGTKLLFHFCITGTIWRKWQQVETEGPGYFAGQVSHTACPLLCFKFCLTKNGRFGSWVKEKESHSQINLSNSINSILFYATSNSSTLIQMRS